MNNTIVLIKTVKSQLNQEEVIRILSYIGYEFNRSGKFKLRLAENTASAAVGRNGNIKDFGSGWYGDIISVLKEFHNLTTLEATKYVADCIGVHYE
ncbi:MAG: hypothetical protein U9R50_00115 [Campylobacterota bacterium]|nr:hypothetical protein [Campylobacterota bacterium]